MRLDPKENRERIKRLLADIGEDYEILALENKLALEQYKADRLLVEIGLIKIRMEPCKCN